jgi:hypothetical protein
MVPVAIAMPAPHGIGDRIGRGAGVRLARRTSLGYRSGMLSAGRDAGCTSELLDDDDLAGWVMMI